MDVFEHELNRAAILLALGAGVGCMLATLRLMRAAGGRAPWLLVLPGLAAYVSERAYAAWNFSDAAVRAGTPGSVLSAVFATLLLLGLHRMLPVYLSMREAQAALKSRTHELGERVKELSCLYSLAQIAARPEAGLSEILEAAVKRLPPAWQYADAAFGRIVFDGDEFPTAMYTPGRRTQSAPLRVNGEQRGLVEVGYATDKPDAFEGPFLAEERNLIDAIAGQLGLIVERKLAAQEKERLYGQLRHADRLATIGQLSAGVAHELNEPLGNILGFAQLARKSPELSEQAAQDVDQIVMAALHAREIVRKLMLFARQMPPKKTPVDLNKLIQDGLYFLEARCQKHRIELVRDLSPELMPITADQSQLHQVLVNLVVNAVQAMPDGGRLVISTAPAGDYVTLTVRDTGIGMTEEIRRQVFVPFFTTKDVNEGTGLGLPVVHGIVAAHGGAIEVKSEPGRGSEFEVRLPVSAPGGEEEDPND